MEHVVTLCHHYAGRLLKGVQTNGALLGLGVGGLHHLGMNVVQNSLVRGSVGVARHNLVEGVDISPVTMRMSIV